MRALSLLALWLTDSYHGAIIYKTYITNETNSVAFFISPITTSTLTPTNRYTIHLYAHAFPTATRYGERQARQSCIEWHLQEKKIVRTITCRSKYSHTNDFFKNFEQQKLGINIYSNEIFVYKSVYNYVNARLLNYHTNERYTLRNSNSFEILF